MLMSEPFSQSLIAPLVEILNESFGADMAARASLKIQTIESTPLGGGGALLA